MTGIVKGFPGVRALDGVDLDVRAGEVHCLLGQNGAGKSTLIKVLSGFHQPDEGTIVWDGRGDLVLHAGQGDRARGRDDLPGARPGADLDVTENIFLGHEVSRAGFTRRGQARERSRELLARMGHAEISPTRLVGSCRRPTQQIVSMARALSHDTRLLVLDEPSAVLDQEEVENLFRVGPRPDRQGVAVVYISHRLEEIRQIGDRITVLKDGRTVATGLAGRARPRPRADPADDRPLDRVRLPAAARDRPRARRRRCWRSGLGLAGVFRASTSPCTPARSSAWPGWSARAAPRSSRRCTAPAGPPPARCRRRQADAAGLGHRGGARRDRPGARGAQEPGPAARRGRSTATSRCRR